MSATEVIDVAALAIVVIDGLEGGAKIRGVGNAAAGIEVGAQTADDHLNRTVDRFHRHIVVAAELVAGIDLEIERVGGGRR